MHETILNMDQIRQVTSRLIGLSASMNQLIADPPYLLYLF